MMLNHLASCFKRHGVDKGQSSAHVAEKQAALGVA
jgi:hypothetical protein